MIGTSIAHYNITVVDLGTPTADHIDLAWENTKITDGLYTLVVKNISHEIGVLKLPATIP